MTFNTRAGFYESTPRRAPGLDHPSLALPLPNSDIVANDDYNHRVIVVDPQNRTGSSGSTGAPASLQGRRAGYLDNRTAGPRPAVLPGPISRLH